MKVFWLSLAILALGTASACLADDDLPIPVVIEPDPVDPGADVRPKGALDEGLEKLDKTQDDRDLLEEAIRGMRKAQGLIEQENAGEETRKVQDQVVQDLDKLIKDLQQQLQNPQNQDQQNQNQDQQKQKPLASVQRPKQKPEPQPKPEPKPEEKPGQKEKARDSSEDQAARKRQEAEEARRRKLSQDVWGHLPPHVRKEINSIFTEKYLPKYADSVRDYYEALAEKSRQRK